jgi:hypothetical protein
MIRFRVLGGTGSFANGRWRHDDARALRSIKDAAALALDYGWGPDPELMHVREVIERLAGEITDLSQHKAPPEADAPPGTVF